jgi:hypothetical protein
MSHNNAGLVLSGMLGLPTSLFILFMAFRKEPAFPDSSLEIDTDMD